MASRFPSLSLVLALSVVPAASVHVVTNQVGGVGPLSYWADFDWNGSVGASDFNSFVTHVGHDCDTPLP